MCIKRLFLVLALFHAFAAASPAPAPDVFKVMAEFDREAATGLWPGFEPQKIPLALYDGKKTWLFHHPHPPEEFTESPEHKGGRRI